MPYGWVEYRISHDAGQTWEEVRELPYAKQAFLDGLFTISVEKAVGCADGTIVAFCLRNAISGCEPWRTPTYVRSLDSGMTWTEAQELCEYRGRIYDAIVCDDCMYVLLFCNDAEVTFTGNKPEHVYRLYRSDDYGASFSEVSVIPFDAYGRGYGSLLLRLDGSLIVYAYHIHDETHMDYAISDDMGKTWREFGKCLVRQRIRNPQTALIEGSYLLHGRAGEKGFVFYTSQDGIAWDEGYIFEAEKQSCYYSNNLVLNDPAGGKRLLVQFSQSYSGASVNVMHLWIKKCQ